MSEQPGQRQKNNITPDLDDEKYLEQVFLLAQAVSTMPGVRNGAPNVSTPPPIRPRWASFMISLGIRIHPELATHRLVATGPRAAGGFGPRQRTSLSHSDLQDIFAKMSPEMHAAVQRGEVSVDDLGQKIPADVMEALRAATQMAQSEHVEEPRDDAT